MITLALDVGGTGVKGCLLNEAGRPITSGERFETPNPATPEAIIEIFDTLARNLGAFDRASVGFPGVVKKGATLTAHNLDKSGLGSICRESSRGDGRSRFASPMTLRFRGSPRSKEEASNSSLRWELDLGHRFSSTAGLYQGWSSHITPG